MIASHGQQSERSKMAVGTRTAPDATGAVTDATATLHLIDASGDQITDAILSTTAPTGANIEAWAAAYQASSQASLWKVSLTTSWTGDADPDNAGTGSRDSSKDGVNMLWKNLTTLRTQTPRLVAPLAACMQGNQDIPLLTATEFTALIAAYQALMSGFSLQSAQYTERRERSNNPKIKA